MDMKLLTEGTNNDIVISAYTAMASRGRRREVFYRAFSLCCALAVLSAAACCFYAVSSGKAPSAAIFEDPGTLRVLLKRFFIAACLPAACFLSAYTPFYRIVCPLCCCAPGALCGVTVMRAVRRMSEVQGIRSSLSAFADPLFGVCVCLAVAVFSAVCVGYGSCRIRYGVTASDRDNFINYALTALSVILALYFFRYLLSGALSVFK